jgi:Tol biopolymer transport system component
MLVPRSPHPMARSGRFTLSLVFLLGVASGLAGCDDSDSALAPVSQPVAGEPVASDATVAAVAALGTQRLVFASYDKMRADLYLIDPQGTNRSALTTWANIEFGPSWSYDHKHVAMVRLRTDASNAQHYDIFLMDADGTHKHWAKPYTSSFHIQEPAWSPDGTRLVVTVTLQNLHFLATLELATGQLTLVTEYGGGYVQGREPSYDPTGKEILFVGNGGNTVDMVIPGSWHYGLVSSDTRVSGPTYSPDGKRIAYSRLLTGTTDSEIFVLTFGIYTTKRLTTSGGYDGEPSWSPDGSRIAFTSSRSGRPQIWAMSSSTGGNLARVTKSDRDDAEPAWSH